MSVICSDEGYTFKTSAIDSVVALEVTKSHVINLFNRVCLGLYLENIGPQPFLYRPRQSGSVHT